MAEAWAQQIERIALATFQRGHRSVGVTSPQSGSGVSSVASGVARVAALSGSRTLLIDLTHTVEEHTYRSAWLPGQGGAGQAITRHADGYDRLVARFDQSTRLLFNNVERMRQTLNEDLAPYASIVVDAPAVPTVDTIHINGAAALAACDAAVLVCMSGKVSRADLEAATNALTNAQVNCLGLVLNDMHNPTLGAELAREARRLRRFLPRLSRWLERRALASALLN